MGNETEHLVVEIVAAHNLMPKDGQGSSSPFVEVEFENQRRRTTIIHKDLNPVWNEALSFPVSNPSDLPYRAIDVGVYNERGLGAGGSGGRNFLGKVRVPAAGVPSPGEDAVPQLFTLEKRSLFSHIRGEISLKIYRTAAAANSSVSTTSSGAVDRKLPKDTSKQPPPEKTQTKNTPLMVVHSSQPQKQAPPPVRHPDTSPMDLKPVILAPGPVPGHHPFPVPVVVPNGGPPGSQDFALKETRPRLGGGGGSGGDARDKTSATYDLVERMQYLYVRLVRARDFPTSSEAHAEVKLGNFRGVTRSSAALHWDQVFAFSKDSIQSSMVEIFVKEGHKEDFVGRVAFDLGDVPWRAPPDSTLAPQWCRMENKKGERLGKGEVMVSVWFGTQADEAFAEAWHSKAAAVQGDGALGSIKSKVYVAPKLWYLRVCVFEAQDLVPVEKGTVTASTRFSELFAKVQVGNQLLRTRSAVFLPNRSPSSPYWNEDLMFVVAEPFEDFLAVSVEEKVAPNRDEMLGRVIFPVSAIERRLNEKHLASRWFTLDQGQGNAGGGGTTRFGSRIHLRLSLECGYHVLEEATAYSSDLRPTAKQLWSPHVGVLELGILGASGLMPMKARVGRGVTDAYCVAKYGQKWIRTRTVVESLNPRWNEQYTWEVFDPCTVITIGVFDNCHIDQKSPSPTGGMPRHGRIGKIRIRLSTLEADRVYTHAYPLLVLHPTGVKKMGELHLAVRFSCADVGNMYHAYARPLLPKMHYVDPLNVRQVQNLRFQATNVVATKLGRAEPPLGREVVEYMLDHGSDLWSMRRSKANFFRLLSVFSALANAGRCVESVRSWQQPVHSVAFVVIYLFLVACPELILPAAFSAMAIFGLWQYRARPRHPPHMDTRLSHADAVYVDELDEELDTFPTSRPWDVVRVRYDRLRSVAGRVQMVVGDIASQGERVQALLSWRDPWATLASLAACLGAAAVLYVVPMKLLLGGWGLYVLRPPRFRSRMPSPLMSFFRRLPTKADSML